MSLKIDRVELEIVIKNDESRKRLREMDEEMRKLSTNLKKLPKDSQEWIDKSEQLKKLQIEYDKIYDKIGLTNLSLKELARRQQQLNGILAQVPGDSPLYKKYKDQLDQVKGRIKELKMGSEQTHFSLGKMADGFNRYFALASAFAASLTGIVMGFKALKEERDKMEDSKANLKALTGLGQEDVDRLAEMAKKMSVNQLEGTGIRIRQSAQEIIDAYTKVGSQKPELLKDAEALNEVTKQALILATASKMEVVPAAEGLTNMMNQYGVSAKEAAHYMNVLAAGSQAGAKEVPYISEAMTKFGSVAKLANVPVEQAVALIESLGEKGHAAEIAGTGLKTFFVKLMQGADATNPAVVGMSKALENLNEKFSTKGGFSKMVKLFGQENVVIAQTLIASKSRFEDLTKAVTDTTVGIEQAAVNSTTPAAMMAQSINKMKIAGVELVDKMQPAMSLMTGWFSKTVQVLPGVVDWFKEWGGVIVKTTIVLGAYIVATKLNVWWTAKMGQETLLAIAIEKAKIVWQKISTAAAYLQAAAFAVLHGATKLARLAMIDFFATLGLNPFGAILLAVAAVGVAIYSLAMHYRDANVQFRTLMDVQTEANKQTAAQKTELELLLEVARNNNASLEERRKAMKRINEISPEYLGNITLENIGKEESIKAIDNYIAALDREAIAKASQDKMTEIRAKQMENLLKIKEKQAEIDKLNGAAFQGLRSANPHAAIVNLQKENAELEVKAGFLKEIHKANVETETVVRSAQTIKDDYAARKIAIQKELTDKKITREEFHKKMMSAEAKYHREMESFNQSEATKAVAQKKLDEKLAVLNAAFKKERDELDKKHAANLISENEYQKQMDALSDKYKRKKSAILTPKEKKTDETSVGGGSDKSTDNPTNKALETKLKKEEDIYKSNQAKIKERQAKDLEHEQKYLDELDALELKYLEQKKATLKAAGQSTGDVELQIANKKMDMLAKVNKELEKSAAKTTKEQKEEADKRLKILETLEAGEVALLDEKRNKGLISESAYQAELLAIEADYLGKKLKLAGLSDDKIEALKKQLIENGAKSSDNRAKDRASFNDKYASEAENLTAWKTKEKQILDDFLKRGIITDKEAKEAQALLDKEFNLKKIENYSKAAQEIANVAGGLASAAQGFQQAEEMSVNRKYDKLIKAAGKNQKQVTKLEDQKEKELAAVRAKWADKAFVLTVAQVVAQTAVAAISAYASAVKVPIVGPMLAPIAAAAAVAAGAAQLAVANQARQQAKEGLYTGGYSQDYVEGYTASGNPREAAGVISVHKDEFVGNHQGVGNPHVKQFYDVFNMAQKSGRIGMLNTTEILGNLRMKGLYEGGYSRVAPAASVPTTHSSTSNQPTMADITNLANVLGRLSDRLDRPIRANVSVTGRDGINENQKLYTQMMANKSR